MALRDPTGELAVNLDAKTLEVDGTRVHLTGKEYAMLELVSLREGLSSACGGETYIAVWGRGHVLRDPGEKVEAA